ncbi:rapid response to glucose protein [Colletotrichum scovillei]|uniref:Rapid response to glucose protein n=1 Tax=Colletotrichum scovillei TaxID=1209932 RepID=A0A9P7QWQ5_9PEZI|nr:rapid response to glucose protein [Colletotrichum scovillei]KAG7049314.1 rapid response to glucose protein [Colletotrichum scovillei]KAG7064054.1 rapid response to glucose protein [Colletotrichum scovillei]
MVGQITYTEEEIIFILHHSLVKDKDHKDTLREYEQRFSKPLTMAQLKYVRAKYGHDPEFGTAMINGQVPDNGGNRKTAVQSPWQEEMVAPIQYKNDQSDQSFTVSTNEDESASEDHMLQALASYVYDSPSEAPENLALSSDKAQQDEQARIDAEEYAAAHEKILQMFQENPDRPYGVQPVQQYYEQMLFPSTVQKRKRDELEEADEGSITTPDSGSSPAVLEGPQESIPKRLKTQPQETYLQELSAQYLSPMLNNNAPQTTGHDDEALNLLNFNLPEVPGTPENLRMGTDHVHAERDPSLSPLTKLLNSIDNEYPQGPTTDSSFFTQLDRQMDPSGYSTVDFENTMFQEPNPPAAPMWTGADPTMLSASPSLNFSQSMQLAPWEAPHNEEESNFWGTQSDTWQGMTGYDTAPGFNLDPLVPQYAQTSAPHAYAEMMASAGGPYQGSGALTSVQQQVEGQNIAGFSGDINVDWNNVSNAEWDELFTYSAEPQGHADYSQQFFGPLE